MIDIKLIRENPELLKESLKRRGEEVRVVDTILELDKRRRERIKELDGIRHKRKELSREIARSGSRIKMDRASQLKKEEKELERGLSEIEVELRKRLLSLPNIPHPSVQDKDEIVYESEEKPQFDFKPLTHWDLGEALGILDFKSASKLSGSRFVVYKGEGARLARALINFCLDTHIREHRYLEVYPPILAKEECFWGAGEFPNLISDVYKCKDDPLYLIPTAETLLVNLHQGEILKEEDLPKYYVAYTPCFRREAGSYGRDVRGMIRVHQFDKVELVKYTLPEESYSELEKLLKDAIRIVKLLGLPYRVKLLSAKEMAFQSAKTYDIDVWAAGVGRWLEVSSVSNCEDFQARRNNTKLRRKDGRIDYPHILNGSGIAFARTFVALIENNQERDGSIKIPEPLRPYMDGKEKIE